MHRFSRLLFILFLLSSSVAVTAEKTKTTGAIRADVFKVLEKAQASQEAGDTRKTLQLLDSLKNRSGKKALKPYEAAQVWNFYAYTYLAMEEYSKAIKAFENVLKQKELPDALALATRFTLAQLYFGEGKVETAVSMLESWFKAAANPAADAYVLLAKGYLQLQQLDKALTTLLKAFDVAKQKQAAEKENWYALLQYIYAEKKNLTRQEEVLEVLVSRWPKPNYWMALIGVYAEQDKDNLQLYTMETAYVQGMLEREPYLVSLAQMLAASGAPFKAAKVMEQGFKDKQIKQTAKNLERTGEYWRRSQEVTKALPRLLEAAKESATGETALRLAYVYMNLHQYENAVEQFQLALKKQGLRNPLQARLMLAQSQFHAQSFTAAEQSFKRVMADAGRDKPQQRLKKQAQQWLTFMQGEVERLEEVKRYLKS